VQWHTEFQSCLAPLVISPTNVSPRWSAWQEPILNFSSNLFFLEYNIFLRILFCLWPRIRLSHNVHITVEQR
jgi:hypothetical protein